MSRRWVWLFLIVAVGACWYVSLSKSMAKPKAQDHTNKDNQDASNKGASNKGAGAGGSAGAGGIDSHIKATTESLGGAARYLTMVSTDKPIYHPGEKVFVRGVVLNAADHTPLPSSESANATIQIKGSRGDVLSSGTAYTQDSVWGFSWEVPAGQAGGEYTVFATYPWNGHAPAQRKFDIRDYRAPRLKSQITFLRDGYGPGEKVTATLDVKRAEGGVPQGANVTVNARVDGEEIKAANGIVDANGFCTVSFDLPHDIPRGEGTLSLVIADGGVVETASKTIPILLQTVDLQLYPEGGDIISGFKNRVYVQAHQPNGKPADLSGKVMAKQGGQSEFVTNFHTEHEGRGRFEFTPEAGKDYYLTISVPAGIKTIYNLPKTKSIGATIRSDADTFKKGQPVSVKVGCTDKSFRVTLAKREVEIASDKVDSSKSNGKATGAMHTASFDVPPNVDGVLCVTVWDSKGIPLAERLIFREPAKPLNITITPEKKAYIPGDSAKVTVKATDGDGKPVSTVVGITVTDDSVLEMVEKRDKAPRLPVMLFLEPEVEDLADSEVYLDPKNSKASIATDLLLGTQGWRRFALVDASKFIKDNGDSARRVLALKTPPPPMELQEGMPEGGMAFGGRAHAGMFPAAPVPVDRVVKKGQALDLERDQKQKMPVDAERQKEGDLLAKIQSAKDVNLFQAEPVMAKNEIAFAPGMGAPAMRRRAMLMDERMAIVREFAHQVRPNRKPNDRVDFAETLYWNTGVKTDPKTGEASVSFGLNDSVTTFRVFADGFTSNGAIGAANVGVESVQPFYVEAKMPLEVTDGDHVLLPISLVNATSNNLADVALNVALADIDKLPALQKNNSGIAAGERVRWIQPIDVGSGNGLKAITLSAKTGVYEDQVARKLSVKPKGFPIEVAFGGVLEPGKTATHSITIPGGVTAGSLESNTAIYPTPLANLTEALERMIQDPNGCFEQTSSTSYPLTMAQQYFLSHTSVDPKLVEASRLKLDDGYKKLVGFWCPDRGYEWFGQDPGHEALTAFGLLHFTDMQKVRDVDQNMITTTRAWLLKQKDGQGGFTRKRRALHTWIEDKDCSNAYILWALLECGQPASDLKPELDSIKKAATASQNNYVVALAANALYLSGDKSGAKNLMDRLAAKQKADGSVDGVTSSIVGSGGESLEVEGTALATLAWLRDPAYTVNVEKSVKYLADSCKSGRYGSTQATVLALRAIVNYDKQRARPKAPGKVHICVDGKQVGDWMRFDQNTQGAIKLPDLTNVLTAGTHKLELTMEGGSAMPYSMSAKYNALVPASAKECKLDLVTKIAQDKVAEGASTEVNVTVVNKSKDVVPNPVAIIGLPGGLEPRHQQLKELVKKGTIDAYEVRGREVVLYWRTLPGDARVNVPISLIAAVPGSYTGPASRTYLYYTDENKQWIDGLKVEIAAK